MRLRSARGAPPSASRPQRPVVFVNPRSGGGKAQRLALADEARARAIEPVELGPGDDLAELVREAVSRGVDALAVAGGDGSQAVVAAIASEHSLPFACIPAGTRNHLALDLGVDTKDVVGALDALVDGSERVVDLADVNGRVFVNNVSLGLYGKAVQRPEYRRAKLRTLLGTIPETAGAGGHERLRWTDSEGEQHETHGTVLVSNNVYRVRRFVGVGAHRRLDEGVLGVVVIEEPAQPRTRRGTPWRRCSATSFVVDSDGLVVAGIDGEPARLEPPLRFSSRPRALRVRIARGHPGASQ